MGQMKWLEVGEIFLWRSQIENTYIVEHMVLTSGASPVQTPSICLPWYYHMSSKRKGFRQYSSLIGDISNTFWGSQVVLVIKNPPANAGDGRHMDSIPGSGRTPGGENGNPLLGSGILAWRIPWTEEPGRLQSIGLQKVRRNWTDLAHMHAHKHFKKDLPLSFYSWWCWVIEVNYTADQNEEQVLGLMTLSPTQIPSRAMKGPF